MYSQRDEEKYIVKFFKGKQGRFLDIGAYDGKTFSNTYQLALQNWGGVCVEPSPSLHKPLEDLYGKNEKIKIIKTGVGPKHGIFPFYNFYGDAIGSFDKTHAKLWEEKGKRKWKEMMIEVITVEELFTQIGFDFDFVNIDTEGWSWAILQEFPFAQLEQLKMICIEFDYEPQRIINLVKPFGFRLYYQTAENLILGR